MSVTASIAAATMLLTVSWASGQAAPTQNRKEPPQAESKAPAPKDADGAKQKDGAQNQRDAAKDARDAAKDTTDRDIRKDAADKGRDQGRGRASRDRDRDARGTARRHAEELTHDGKVVSITGDKLVMTSKDGQEHSHKLTADAKLTLDGKNCKVADLKPGTRIRVTTQRADKSVANRIEGLDKNLDFASNRHDGKVVSITGNKLVMTSKEDGEHSHSLTPGAKLTLDGKACKATDLKPGTKIRVTTQGADNSLVNQIEGLDKNLDFASI
jgi:hypothetical protein